MTRMPEDTVRYVARYKWPFRLIAVLFAALLAVIRPGFGAIWKEDGWLFGIGALIAYAFAVAGLLESFIRQTWLTSSGFYQRSMFGRTRFVPYADVAELVIHRDEALVVKCRNKQHLKVHAKEGEPEAIIEAARPFLDADTRVVTV